MGIRDWVEPAPIIQSRDPRDEGKAMTDEASTNAPQSLIPKTQSRWYLACTPDRERTSGAKRYRIPSVGDDRHVRERSATIERTKSLCQQTHGHPEPPRTPRMLAGRKPIRAGRASANPIDLVFLKLHPKRVLLSRLRGFAAGRRKAMRRPRTSAPAARTDAWQHA